jgi:hypothetical protein
MRTPSTLAIAIRLALSGPRLTPSDMDWSLRRPCSDCPFRRATPYHVGVARGIWDLILLIDEHRFAHTCHKTDPRSDSPEGQRWKGRTQHCMGSLFMLAKTGRGADLQLPLLEAMQAGKIDAEGLERRAKRDRACYRLGEFLAFYGERK